MQLPFFKKKKEEEIVYLGLFLKEAEGTVLLIRRKKSDISLVDKIHFSYSNGLENLIEDLDDALFQLEKKNNVTLKDTIFFIYSHFVDEKKQEIKKPYLNKIKEITKNLELNPLGYVECSEAIVKYIESKEELSLSAVIVELDKTNLDVFVFKGGKQLFVKNIARTDSVVSDLAQCLTEAKSGTLLPTRIILYDSGHVNEYSTSIITHKWEEHLFVQLPRVDVVNEQELLNSLLFVFKKQILSEVIEENKGLQKTEDDITENLINEDKEEKKEDLRDEEVEGFVIGEDIEKMEPSEKIKQEEIAIPLGADKEIKNTPVIQKKPLFAGLLRMFAGLRTFLGRSFKGSPTLLLILFGVVIILSSVFLNEYYLHVVTVTLFVPTNILQDTYSIQGKIGNEKGDVAIYVATSSASYSDTKTTSGVKEIGNKATGSVNIYNLNDSEKSITAGTLFSVGSLQYSLDEDVTVPAATIDQNTNNTQPGKQAGKLTAVELGSDSNIDKGKRFAIEGLSQTIYYALNDEAFSGGSKSQIQTVATKDITDLKTSILKKASVSKETGTQMKLPADARFIDQLSDLEISNVSSSKEVGEEARQVTVKATVLSTRYYYVASEFNDYFSKKFEADSKQGYILEPSTISYSLQDVVQKDNTITMKIPFKAKEILDINKTAVENDLKGIMSGKVEQVLKNKYHAVRYDLRVKQPIPFFQFFFPFFTKNIHVSVTPI